MEDQKKISDQTVDHNELPIASASPETVTSTNKQSPNNAKTDKKPKNSNSKAKSNYNRSNLSSNRNGNHGQHSNNYENYGLENDSPLYGLNGNGRCKVGTKKTNLNHLLNFTYESRDPQENYYEYEKSTKQFWSTKLSKGSVFSKEQFLQANCQFVVKNTGDYTVHLVDPDRLVDWDKIEEIRIETFEAISCPICLYEPVCGKMTKCGHIYCWSCILHYLSLSDKTWRKCPICYESIYKHDLKSVQVVKHKTEYKIGDEIKMNLMFRFKTKYNTLILPASLYEQFTNDEKLNKNINFNLFNSSKYNECKQFFKIHCKTSKDIYDEIVKRERVELENQQEAEKSQPEVCFVNEAITLLVEREQSLLDEINKSPVKPNRKQATESFADAFENILEEKKEEEIAKPVDLANSTDLAYFYQSSDGQRIYVNGLNNRCLISEYSSLCKCPLTLSAKIVAQESYFMSEENRKRYKYLAHLPLHSEFKLAELDLKEPIISQKTIELFKEEIEDRKRTRQRKQNREKREAERIAALADSTPHYYVQSAMSETVTYIKSPVLEPVIDYASEFPEASTSPPFSSSGSLGDASIGTASSVGGINIESVQKSFAQMLKVSTEVNMSSTVANIPKTAWPAMEPNATSSSSSTQLTSGWVTMAKQQQQQQSMTGKAKRCQPSPSAGAWGLGTNLTNEKLVNEAESEDYMPAPQFKQSFFTAIDESFKILESSKEENLTNEETVSSKDKQKKKKKTKQLLFSTSLNMGF